MSHVQKRISWVDWVKGIGILTIVMSHVTQYFPGGDIYLNKVLCSYHVPVFFLMGGISASLWIDKYSVSRHSFYLKRVRRYLIPYILYSVFNSVLKFGVLLVTHKLQDEIVKDELICLFITGNGTVWFLVTLFLTEALFYETRDHKYLRYVLMLIGLVIPFCIKDFTPLLLVFVRVVFAFFYFMAGYMLWNWFSRNMVNISSMTELVFGILLIMGGCIIAYAFQYKIAFYSGVFLNGFIAVPVSLLFSAGIIFCLHSIRETGNKLLKGIQYFGKESMLIMLNHTTILLLFTYPFERWFGALPGIKSFSISMCLFVIVLILNVPLICIINRWFPILKGEIRVKSNNVL